MRLLHSIDDLATIDAPIVIAAGVFDGLHHGHRAVLEEATRLAASTHATTVALTFDPHPATILRPSGAPRLLTPTPLKLRLLERLGIPCTLLIPFDTAFASLPATAFLDAILASAKHLAGFCIGHDWRFGHRRSGDATLLAHTAARHHFATKELDPVTLDGLTVSSTLVRQTLAAGRLDQAARLLGRPHTIAGTVLPGASLGARIGFPTANILPGDAQLPPLGVYAVHTRLGDRHLPGVANLGIRPTINPSPTPVLETHLFDFDEDITGREIEVSLLHFLRPEQKFTSTDALRDAIARDTRTARSLLRASPPPAP